MKLIRIGLAALIVTLNGCGAKEEPMTKENADSEQSPGSSLRNMILTTSVSEYGFTPDEDFPHVCGVISDFHGGDVFVSVMSLRDGTTSVYTTTSFGMLGGGGDKKVREAALEYIRNAEKVFYSSKLVTEFPYPENGKVYYYLMTYNGVRRVIGNAPTAENPEGSGPTMPLFSAAQNVLHEMIMLNENAQQSK